jgi:malonate-semialdehyde dehydrogenase (acetylating) / methylmalonate-semialdehyde dehydrogenase
MTTTSPPTYSVIPHRIEGRVALSEYCRREPAFNPATGEVARHVGMADESEVHAAVNAARQALPAWAEPPPIRRARVLNHRPFAARAC